jgi:hypothetical protein
MAEHHWAPSRVKSPEPPKRLADRGTRHSEAQGDRGGRDARFRFERRFVLLPSGWRGRLIGPRVSGRQVLERRHELPGSITGGRVEPLLLLGRTSEGWRLTQPRRSAHRASCAFLAELRAIALIGPCRFAFSACSHTVWGTGGHGGVSPGWTAGHRFRTLAGREERERVNTARRGSAAIGVFVLEPERRRANARYDRSSRFP